MQKLDKFRYPFNNINVEELDALQTFVEDIDLEDHEIEFTIEYNRRNYERDLDKSRKHLLYKTLDKINKMGYEFDIYNLRNVMVRTSDNKNTLVIVDPIYSYEDLD